MFPDRFCLQIHKNNPNILLMSPASGNLASKLRYRAVLIISVYILIEWTVLYIMVYMFDHCWNHHICMYLLTRKSRSQISAQPRLGPEGRPLMLWLSQRITQLLSCILSQLYVVLDYKKMHQPNQIVYINAPIPICYCFHSNS